jgi:hypothetical protein
LDRDPCLFVPDRPRWPYSPPREDGGATALARSGMSIQ